MTLEQLNYELDLMNATVKGLTTVFYNDLVNGRSLEDAHRNVKEIADKAYAAFLDADNMEALYTELIKEKRFRIYDAFLDLVELYNEREQKCGSMGGMNDD